MIKHEKIKNKEQIYIPCFLYQIMKKYIFFTFGTDSPWIMIEMNLERKTQFSERWQFTM